MRAHSSNDQGSALTNSRLDPGETAIIEASLSNIGEDLRRKSRGSSAPHDPLITVHGFPGHLRAHHHGRKRCEHRRISSSSPSIDTCPTRLSFTLHLELRTQGGHYPYSITRSLHHPRRHAAVSDPTGPDAFGYYAYTSDDSVYEQSPEYAWLEIDGIGTIIPRNSNGDFTRPSPCRSRSRTTIPSYTKVRISSDGWVAFGSGTQVWYRTMPLPNGDNVNNMVALRSGTTSSPSPARAEHGRLLYYTDAANTGSSRSGTRSAHYQRLHGQGDLPGDPATIRRIIPQPPGTARSSSSTTRSWKRQHDSRHREQRGKHRPAVCIQ